MNLVFIIAVAGRFRGDWVDVFSSNNYIALLLYVNLIWIIATNMLGYYKPARINMKWQRRLLIFIQLALLHLVLVLAFNGLIKTYYSRLFLIYFYVQFFVLVPLTELLVRRLIGWYQKQKGITLRIVFAGQGNTPVELARYFKNLEYDVHQREVIQLNGPVDNLLTEIRILHEKMAINELYCSAATVPEPVLMQLGNYCENNLIRVRLIMDYPKWETKPLEVVQFDSIPVINIPVTPLDEPANKLTKRIFDIVFCVLVIVFVLSWLFPVIAILIKLSSTGPVIFRQRRTGLDNRQFDCWKFRSMRLNATADLVQASQNDPRITPVGRFLRKTSLDELPQFFNVLRGEMSVVGPRPHMLKHTEEYASRVGRFMQRHAIRPGVTGLAQIKGYRGEITHFEHLSNRVKYDRFYVENWSLTLDLKIILQTVVVVLQPNRHI